MLSNGRITLALLLFLIVTCSAKGENWPFWRGENQDGHARGAAAPAEWSETSNIIWKTPLPGWAGSTPIIWGDRIFITSPSGEESGSDGGRRLPSRMGGREKPGGPDIVLMCISRSDGKLVWQRKLGGGNRLYGKQNMSSPSCVTDGAHVWAMTGTGVLACFDFDGNEKWRKDLVAEHGPIELMWGYGSSPMLHGGRVIVPVLHTGGPSYVVAFDGVTGKQVWKVERKTDARAECPDAYTTPLVARRGAAVELIISGADWVTGHDATTGEERWRAAGINPEKKPNYRVVASPIAIDDLILAPTRVRPMIAVKSGGKGDVTASHVAWKYEKAGGPDVPTPAHDGEYIYMVDDKGLVTCLNPADGERVWGPVRTASGTVSASPVIAAGKLYVTNESATTTVLATGPEHRVIATNQLDDTYTISSMAVCGGRIFLRSSTNLYCIGDQLE